MARATIGFALRWIPRLRGNVETKLLPRSNRMTKKTERDKKSLLGFRGVMKRTAALFTIIATAPMILAAAPPLHLSPSSRWRVSYAENSCRLNRTFGTGDNLVYLTFESEAPGHVDMIAFGKPLSTMAETLPGRFLPVQVKPMEGRAVKTAYGPGVLWSRVYLVPDEVVDRDTKREKQQSASSGIRPPPLDLIEEAQDEALHVEFTHQATAIEIEIRRGRPVILDTGSLGAAIKAFDKCSLDSLSGWGVNAEVEDRIVRPAWSPNTASWFTSDDYPRDMAIRREESDVKVRLLVDATGRVTKCTSLSHYRENSFNDVVCKKFTRRAHFEPAELADGTKVPSFYINHIIFKMAH